MQIGIIVSQDVTNHRLLYTDHAFHNDPIFNRSICNLSDSHLSQLISLQLAELGDNLGVIKRVSHATAGSSHAEAGGILNKIVASVHGIMARGVEPLEHETPYFCDQLSGDELSELHRYLSKEAEKRYLTHLEAYFQKLSHSQLRDILRRVNAQPQGERFRRDVLAIQAPPDSAGWWSLDDILHIDITRIQQRLLRAALHKDLEKYVQNAPVNERQSRQYIVEQCHAVVLSWGSNQQPVKLVLVGDNSVTRLPDMINMLDELRELSLQRFTALKVWPQLSALKGLQQLQLIQCSMPSIDIVIPLIARGCKVRLPSYLDNAATRLLISEKVLEYTLEQWLNDPTADAGIRAKRSLLAGRLSFAERMVQGYTVERYAVLDLTEISVEQIPAAWPTVLSGAIEVLQIDAEQLSHLQDWLPPKGAKLRSLSISGPITALPEQLVDYLTLEELNLGSAPRDLSGSAPVLLCLAKRNVKIDGVPHMTALLERCQAWISVTPEREWCSLLGVSVPVSLNIAAYYGITGSTDPVFGWMVYAAAASANEWNTAKELLLEQSLSQHIEATAPWLMTCTHHDAAALLQTEWLAAGGVREAFLNMVLEHIGVPSGTSGIAMLAATLVEQLALNRKGAKLRLPAGPDKHARLLELTGLGVALRLGVISPELRAIIEQPAARFKPAELIACLSQEPAIADLYAMDALVNEGYSVSEHTLRVLTQFEKEAPKYAEELRSITARAQCRGLEAFAAVPFMRLAIALHDIGKGLGRTASEQHTYTTPIALAIAKGLGASAEELALLHELIDHDLLGDWQKAAERHLAAPQGLAQTVQSLQARGLASRIPVPDFSTLQYLFYICDASSYPSVLESWMTCDQQGRLCFKSDRDRIKGALAVVERVQEMQRAPRYSDDDVHSEWQATPIEELQRPQSKSADTAMLALPGACEQLADDALRMLEHDFRFEHVERVMHWRGFLRDLLPFQRLQQAKPDLDKTSPYMGAILDALNLEFEKKYNIAFEAFCSEFYVTCSYKATAFRMLAARATTQPISSYVWYQSTECDTKMEHGTQVAARGLEYGILRCYKLTEAEAMDGFALLHALTLEVLQHSMWPGNLHQQDGHIPHFTVLRTEAAQVIQDIYGAHPLSHPEWTATLPHTSLDCGSYGKVAVEFGKEVTVYQVPVYHIIGGAFLNRSFTDSTFGRHVYNGLSFQPQKQPFLYLGTYKEFGATTALAVLPDLHDADTHGAYQPEHVPETIDPYFEKRVHLAQALGLKLAYMAHANTKDRHWQPVVCVH